MDFVCEFLDKWAACVRSGRKPDAALEETASAGGVTVEATDREWVRVLRFPEDQRIVVKWRDPELRHEASHLQWLSEHGEARAPRLVWPSEQGSSADMDYHLFAMEHIQGHPLRKAIRSEPGRVCKLLNRSIDTLAAIHSLIDTYMAGELEARGPYWKESLRNRLRDDLGRVLERAPACEGHVREVNTDQIARQLSCQEHRVLGHGDYKGNNLLVADVGGDSVIRPIDWVDMGKAAPWYDLAHLLHTFRSASEGACREAVGTYLQQVQGHGLVSSVDVDEAFRMLDYGEMARLITSTASHVDGADDECFFVGRSQQLARTWERCCAC